MAHGQHLESPGQAQELTVADIEDSDQMARCPKATKSNRSRIRSSVIAIVSPMLIAGIVVGVLQLLGYEPFSAFGRNQLLSIEPARTFSCTAHPGDTVTAQFIIQNNAHEPVKLLGSNSSCSCTVVANDFPRELKPGDSETITVHMRISPTAHGEVRHTVDLLVNQPGFIAPLVMVAQVKGPND
jgi:hypothetical protein